MLRLRRNLDKEEHEKIMTRLDEHEEELVDLAERVRALELEAELYKSGAELKEGNT